VEDVSGKALPTTEDEREWTTQSGKWQQLGSDDMCTLVDALTA